MKSLSNNEFQVIGTNNAALFTLKMLRGEGMTLLAMNWKKGQPPDDFVGFAIEYKEPGGDKFFVLKNRLSFVDLKGNVNPNILSTRLSPIQKFRWVHFPRNADLNGEFVYRVTPVFMNDKDELSYGEPQEEPIILKRETYPNLLNVAFTRGFVSSQAFVDRYGSNNAIDQLFPPQADQGLDFIPSHPKTDEALDWMGFEAREEILKVLDEALVDKTAQVRVVAYDLNEPEIVTRLENLGNRLKIIIDDEGDHGLPTSAETKAFGLLSASAGAGNVKRQHMGHLQHNKTIVVNGTNIQKAVCGSTNFSWRGFFVQNNNAIILNGTDAIKPFINAFNNYWQYDSPSDFGNTSSAQLTDIGLISIDSKVGFSPHSTKNALLQFIADDINNNTTSSLFYSLAFLYQTKGVIRNAIEKVTNDDKIFVYGISDKKVGGLQILKPNGNIAPVYPSALSKNLPPPFNAEPTGGGGTRMHHKFVVIDFDKPTARVYIGSYNFSIAADEDNGENLLVIKDRKIATAYVVEAIRIFDHYHFRVSQQQSNQAKTTLALAKPPRQPNELPWWSEYYSDPIKIRDRELFS